MTCRLPSASGLTAEERPARPATAAGARRRDRACRPGLDKQGKLPSAEATYYDKLDLAKVAALGQSCGGGQVWEASKDTRIKAVAALNSSFPTRQAGSADGWTVEKLAIPAAYFIGGPGDSAYARSQASFAAAPSNAAVIKANFPLVGHTGAYRSRTLNGRRQSPPGSMQLEAM